MKVARTDGTEMVLYMRVLFSIHLWRDGNVIREEVIKRALFSIHLRSDGSSFSLGLVRLLDPPPPHQWQLQI